MAALAADHNLLFGLIASQNGLIVQDQLLGGPGEERGAAGSSPGVPHDAKNYPRILRKTQKKKPPVTYRYDSSLAPALDWDGQTPAREQGEALIARVARKMTEVSGIVEAAYALA